MTDEQINQRIAEACGWTVNTPSFGIPPTPTAFSLLHGYDDLPNYCRDLNAMHEAEKLIYNHNNMWTAYYYAIGAGPFSLHATARKKAEAFLRALGKWEEVQG